jgi:hypothetical protein
MQLHSISPYTASRLDILSKQLLDATNTGFNDYLLIEPYSIGDVIQTLSLVPAFRKKYCLNGEKINLICNPRAIPIIGLFQSVDFASGLNCGPLEFHFEALAERYGSIHRHVPILMTPDMYSRGWLGRLLYACKINVMDCKKLILDLDLDERPIIPALNSETAEYKKALDNAVGQGLTKNSVIVFNHANSVNSIDAEVFKALKSRWDNIFWDVVPNGIGCPEWAKPLSIPLEQVPIFVNYTGSAVTLRSGITDLLALSSSNIYTFYPNPKLIKDFILDYLPSHEY